MTNTKRPPTIALRFALLVGLSLVLAGCATLGGGDEATDDNVDESPIESSDDELDTDEESADDATEPTDTGSDLPEGAVAGIADLVTTEPIRCSFDEIIPLPVAPTCHEVVVPENWADPDPDDQVILQVAVFEGDGSHDDPIIYLDGGPGGHTLESLSFSFRRLVEPLLDGRDFVVFDQRGLGESEPSLQCPELTEVFFEDLAGAIGDDERAQVTLDAQTVCVDRLQRSGVDLTAYNSVASANDVEAVRLALGYEQLNPIGISYGTRLGQTYMRMYPDSIRSIVLDSVLPTAADLWTDFNIGAERAYRQLFDGCAASAECSAAHPNFEDDFFALLESLDADPVAVDLDNLITGQTIPAVLDGDDVMGLAFQALYDQTLFSFLPEMTVTAGDGDYEGLQLLGSVAVTNVQYVSSGMQLSVECNEEVVFESPAAREANISTDPRYQRIEAIAGDPNIFESCAVWPSGAAPDVESETVTSDIPTLLLAGQYDPITPPSGMDTIAAGLTTSYQFLFPHAGHGITPTECGARVVAAFIDDPTTEPDSSCIDETPEPDWVPGEGDEKGPVELVEFESTGLIAISGLRPEGWTEAGPGVFSRGSSIADPTTLLVQPTRGLPVENLAALLSSQLDVVFDDNGTVTVDGEQWRSFVGFDDDDNVYEMVANEGVDGVVVMLVATRDERDTLREQVLLPVAAAAEPG